MQQAGDDALHFLRLLEVVAKTAEARLAFLRELEQTEMLTRRINEPAALERLELLRMLLRVGDILLGMGKRLR